MPRPVWIKTIATTVLTSLLFVQALSADEQKAVARQPAARGRNKLLVIAPESFHQPLQEYIEHK